MEKFKYNVKKFFLWIISIFLILAGCVFASEMFFAYVVLIIGVLLLPPVENRIKMRLEEKKQLQNYILIRNIVAIISVILFFSFISTNEIQQSVEQNITNNTELSEISDTLEVVNKELADTSVAETITETNGTYIGNRVNGKKQGNGKYVWNTGVTYEGEFSENMINGQGTLTIPEKGTYIGTFSNGVKNGQGIFQFSNGDTYEGNWVNDQMSGNGTYTFANADKYVGEFSNNQFNGEGTYTKDGNGYTGKWINNQYQK